MLRHYRNGSAPIHPIPKHRYRSRLRGLNPVLIPSLSILQRKGPATIPWGHMSWKIDWSCRPRLELLLLQFHRAYCSHKKKQFWWRGLSPLASCASDSSCLFSSWGACTNWKPSQREASGRLSWRWASWPCPTRRLRQPHHLLLKGRLGEGLETFPLGCLSLRSVEDTSKPGFSKGILCTVSLFWDSLPLVNTRLGLPLLPCLASIA